MTVAIPLDLQGPKVANGVAMRFWADALFEDLDSRKRMPVQIPALIFAIESRGRRTLICRLSIRTVREYCRMGSDAAEKCFKAMVDEGWLIRIRYGSRELNLAAEYRLAVPQRLAKKFEYLGLVDPREAFVFSQNQAREAGAEVEAQQDLPVLVEDEQASQEHQVLDEEVAESREDEAEPGQVGHQAKEVVPSWHYPTPEELRAIEEQERAEAEWLSRRFTRNEYGDYISSPEALAETDTESEPMEDSFEEFRRKMGIKVG